MRSIFSSYTKLFRSLLMVVGFSVNSIAAAEGVYICQSSDGFVINFAQLYLDTNGMWGELTYTATSLGLDEKMGLNQAGDYFYGSTDLTSAVIYLYPDPMTGGYAHLILTIKNPHDHKQYKMNIGCAIPI
jgi:hypothetical protein